MGQRVGGSPPRQARLGKDLERHGLAGDGAAWIDRGRDAVLARLADGAELSAQRLREEIPEIDGRTVTCGATRWQFANQAFAPRLLTVLGAEHHIVRGPNQGHWRTSRPSWTLMSGWLDAVPEQWPAADGYAELVRHWLARFGPGTENDLVWWLGATRSAVRSALAAVDAVPVELDGGATGYLLPGDEKPDDDRASGPPCCRCILTVMGWKEQDFYLDPRLIRLFRQRQRRRHRLVNGRVVGCWVQDEAGRVRR
ncbi:MAG: crosslink repair DNA glycosylase YcaQ family protein [Micropruina sp.]